MPVQVSLNPTAHPPVTVNPQVHNVNQGNETIRWELAAGQNFSFTSLSFAGNPSCFGSPSISNSEISVVDNNPHNGTETTYPYTLVVTANGQQYSSAGSRIQQQSTGPSIKNR